MRVGMVLIHGAGHTAVCWQPTVAELARSAPDLPVLAVDLPGRGDTPEDLRQVTVGRCVEHVVERIEAARLDQVVVVAHSMGALMVPGISAQLGFERVAATVLVAALLPPDGASVLDTLRGPARWVVARQSSDGLPRRRPRPAVARWMFCNGMTAPQRGFVLAQLCDESSRLDREPVHSAGLLDPARTAWVLLRRDRTVRARTQRATIERLGIEDVTEVDAGHDVMVSHPRLLASVLRRHAEPAR